MDLSSVATGLAAAGASNGINIGVLKAVNNLAETQSAILFASIGLGASVNALA